jgi:hypothetical protein
LDMAKRQSNSRSDGRAPDTAKELLIPGKTRPPGRPKGSGNINRNPLTSYASYSHSNNTCYITSLLECLHAAIKHSKFSLPSNLSTDSALVKVLQHLCKRDKTTLKGELNKSGRDVVIKWVLDKHIYESGAFGNPVRIYIELLKETLAPEVVRQHFSMDIFQRYICEDGHESEGRTYGIETVGLLGYHSTHSSDVGEIMTHFFSGTDGDYVSRKCSKPKCSKPVKIVRKISRLPQSVLMFDIHEMDGSMEHTDTFNFPDTLQLSGQEWQLCGRIHSQTSYGLHFFSFVRSDSPMPGIYHYNDLVNDGRATLTTVNPKLTGSFKNSGFVVYAKSPGQQSPLKKRKRK